MLRLFLRSTLVAAALASCAFLPGSAARAEEPVLDFLHAAQDAGYGEIAVLYLQTLQKDGKVPGELLETYDLEMCNSLRVSVGESFNQEEADERTKQAQTHLDKFLKEHPDHPEVVAALVASGSLSFDDGLSKMRLAKLTKDEAAVTKLHTDARTLFEGSRPRFTQAADLYAKRVTELKESSQEAVKPGTPQAKIEKQKEAVTRAIADWIDTRFKGALVDYYIGQTYDAKEPAAATTAPAIDPKTKKPIVAKPTGPRVKALEAAGKAFDEIYQENRNEIEVGRVLAGMYAHMWHGKTAQELGNDQLAQDIYEEVLSATAGDDKSTQATGLEPLFAQVEYFRFLIVQRKEGNEVFAKQAQDWLNRASLPVRDTDGFVAVALELAKAYIAEGEKQPADKQKKYMEEAVKILTPLERRKSEHLAEIINILRQLRKKSGTTEEPKTFAQAMAIADEAMKGEDFEEAVAMYAKALTFPKSKEKTDEETTRATEQLDYAKLGVGRAHYDAGEFDAALALAGEVAKNTSAPAAATAASLGLSVRFAQYASAPDAAAQADALQKLEKAADFMLTNWPNSEPADDARIAKAQIKLVQGQFPEAIAMFESVNPRSIRYSLALYQAAQTHWRLYMAEKVKEDGIRNDEEVKTHRAKAEQELKDGLALEQKAQKGGEMSKNHTDTQLLLAELYVDGGQAKEAAEMIQPLMDNLKANPPAELDNTVLRSYVAALRAYKDVGDVPKMNDMCAQLIDSSKEKDDPKINNVLTALFARMLVDEMKRAQAEVIQAESPLAKEDAQKKVDAVKGVLGTLIEFLATRQQHANPVVSQIFIADTAAELGKTEIAGPLYQKVVEIAAQDPNLKAAVTRIRAQLIGLLRRDKKYAEALTQADALITANPKSLEPLMEKGRILQAWSEEEASHFPDAVNHWTYLRNTLSRMPKKPSQFYEVVYNAANCLYQDGDKTKDATKLKQAEGLLGGTLLNSPSLDGPDRVAQFEELLKKINPEKYKNKK